MSREAEWEPIEPLLEEIKFFPPAISVAHKNLETVAPRVSRFEASSQSADDAVNRGMITFSWTTEGADYVELSYHCEPAPSKPGLVILESNTGRDCENATRKFNGTVMPNRSPNSSQGVLFGNHVSDEVVSVAVTITPFSYGKAHPEGSQAITVAVQPHNPFPQGVPRANGNVSITYSQGEAGTGTYRQGSQLIVHWSDASPRDPCVNLYLVYGDTDGPYLYRAQLGDACLQPSASGSFTWTIPLKFSGSSFRIFALTPGGISSGLGDPFNIVHAAAPQISVEQPGATPGGKSFLPSGSMYTAREFFCATPLQDGRVLVVGGDGTIGEPSRAELYDPATGTFQLTGTPFVKRYSYTATLLKDGRVLIAGGHSSAGALHEAELYDPKTGSFTLTGRMNAARYNHTATLLKSGMVLIAGGMESASSHLDSAELYDPARGSFSATGPLKIARGMHTATSLKDGRVLIAGGQGREGSFPSRAELYDPKMRVFKLTGALNTPRIEHTATLLRNGEVLLAGGVDDGPIGELTSTELYNEKRHTFRTTGHLLAARTYHTATLLRDGKVLMTGGIGARGALASAEIFDPATATVFETSPMNAARCNHAAALLRNGQVLVVGGADQTVLRSAELY